MDPNQPQNPQQPQGYPPQPPQPQPYAATPAPQPATPPQPPTAYSSQPQLGYDPNYLDSIAPAPPAPKFFSGSFGKIFFIMIGLLFLAVSIIIAFSGKDNTADLQQMAVRLDNLNKTTNIVHKNLRSSNLSTVNSNYRLWIADSKRQAEELLSLGGVKKTDYSKDMVAEENTLMIELDEKYEDARLNAKLERIYSSSMASETEKLLNLFNVMARKNKSEKIREYAENASKNLEPLHKSFDEFVDDGN